MDRPDITSVESLRNKKIGVSRIGSGSYVMGYVLANTQNWLDASNPQPFSSVVPLQTFANLRAAVNSGEADFFMWEHFTSKKYYDSGEIRRVGEIYTPWSSWKIVASTELVGTGEEIDVVDARVQDMFEKLDLGVKHFRENPEEAIEFIYENLDYSEEDAREWMKGVEFANGVEGVKATVVEECIDILRKAGVLEEGKGMKGDEMVVKV